MAEWRKGDFYTMLNRKNSVRVANLGYSKPGEPQHIHKEPKVIFFCILSGGEAEVGLGQKNRHSLN